MKRSFEAESNVKACKFKIEKSDFVDSNFEKNVCQYFTNGIFSVNRNVLSSLANLISNVDSHIEDEQMKSDERHFGPMSGLKYFHSH